MGSAKLKKYESQIIMDKVKLTRKQYYSSISKLTRRKFGRDGISICLPVINGNDVYS